MSYATIDHTPYVRSSSDPTQSPSIKTNRKRPPLQHSTCFDQSDFEFTGRSRSVVQFRSNNSNSQEQDEYMPDTPSYGKSEDAEIRSGISFELDAALYPDVFTKKFIENESPYEYRHFGEKVETFYERNYYYNRPGPSTDFKTNSPVFNTSADINDPLQIQRMSVTELFEKFCSDEREVKIRPQPIRQASETCFRTNRLRGISSDRIGGVFLKKTRTDRMSTSSLGDQPGTGSCFSIFDKRKGRLGRLEKSKRLSTSALYDQSPTGNQMNKKTTRIRSSELYYKNYNSDEITTKEEDFSFYNHINVPSTSKSENFVSSKFRFDENPLERASVAKLYEKFCYDDKIKSPSVDNNQSSEENAIISTSSSKPELFSAASLSERTSDIMSSTIKANATIFNFDKVIDDEAIDTSDGISGDRSVSNTVQLLFEDPRSNRTSVSDLYEPCFSVNLMPRKPSFKRDSIKGNWLDLIALDLRPIDDDSPTASKFTSVSSPDDLNSDVFITADCQFSFSINGDTNPMLANITEGDSIEESSSLSDNAIPCDSDKLVIPHISMSSRPSMQKLQPIVLNKKPIVESNNPISTDEVSVKMANISIKNNCAELTVDSKTKSYQVFRIRKVKQIDNVTVHKRTRCFPL